MLASLAYPAPHPRVLRTHFARFFSQVRKLCRGCELSKMSKICSQALLFGQPPIPWRMRNTGIKCACLAFFLPLKYCIRYRFSKQMHMFVVCYWYSMALCGMDYGTHKQKRELFFHPCWKTAKRKINCLSLSKCGRLSHREEKINFKPRLLLAMHICNSYDDNEKVNSVFCELSVLHVHSNPAQPSDL